MSHFNLGIQSSQVVGAPPGGFVAHAVDFDGTDDAFITDSQSGTANKTVLFSAWVRMNEDGVLDRVFSTRTTGTISFGCYRHTDNKFYFESDQVGNHGATDSTYVAADGWVHILYSANAATDTFHLYINDVNDDASHTNMTDTNYAWDTVPDAAIGVRGDGAGSKSTMEASEVYMTNEYLDLDTESNRRKFISADGYPVDLGATGSTPTGTQPMVYVTGEAADWNSGAAQKGSDTGWAMTGTVTDSVNEPVAAEPGMMFFKKFSAAGVGTAYSHNSGGQGLFDHSVALTATRALVAWPNNIELVSIGGATGTTVANVDGPDSYNALGNTPSLCRLTDTKAILQYIDTTNFDLLARVIDITGDVITQGAEFTVVDAASGSLGQPTVMRMEDNKAVSFWTEAAASTFPEFQVLDIDGTTITGNTPVTLQSVVALYPSGQKIGTDKFVASYIDNAGTDHESVCVDLPSTVGTMATIFDDSSASNSSLMMARGFVANTVTTKAMNAYFQTGSTSKTIAATISGTTITWGTAVAMPNGHSSTHAMPNNIAFGDEYGAVVKREGTSSDYRHWVTPYRITGDTTITYGTTVEIFNPVGTGTDSLSRSSLTIIDNNRIMLSGQVETGPSAVYELLSKVMRPL